jgi:twitching motility protein PilT
VSPSDAFQLEAPPWAPSPEDAVPQIQQPLSTMHDLLARTVAQDASDLHLTAGVPPAMRVHGSLAPLNDLPELTSADTEQLVRSVLSAEQWDQFEAAQELDAAYAIPGMSRFRLNVFRQRGSVAAAFRLIPTRIRTVDELGLPHSVESFARLPRGLVLVTGPTGSGKSTTMASLLDVVNKTRSAHIVTIEDPIEFLHGHQRSIVNQREVGSDTASFHVALRQVLRQDPDVILVGEMRDLETTSVALTAAETGHLVFATMHTQSAAQTVERLIDIFPPHQQSQVRAQLAGCLEGVMTQALAPSIDGNGRVLACEILVATPAVRNLIRESKTHQITSIMQSSADVGMVAFDQHLATLYAQSRISKSVARGLAHDPVEFDRLARL